VNINETLSMGEFLKQMHAELTEIKEEVAAMSLEDTEENLGEEVDTTTLEDVEQEIEDYVKRQGVSYSEAMDAVLDRLEQEECERKGRLEELKRGQMEREIERQEAEELRRLQREMG